MGTAPPNMQAMMARQLVQKLAGGGAPPGAQPGPSGSPPQSPGAMAGQQVSTQLSQLQGADPQAVNGMLKQMKSILVALYPRTAFSIPDVAKNLAKSQQ